MYVEQYIFYKLNEYLRFARKTSNQLAISSIIINNFLKLFAN